MQTTKMTVSLNHYKPQAKTLTDIASLMIVPNKTVIQAKADGEFTLLRYENGDCYAVNLWGTMRTDFRALNELATFLKAQAGVESATILAEMYAKKDNVMLKLPQFEHIIKSGTSQEINELVYLGIFDLAELNGKTVNETYEWKLDELSAWITSPESHAQLLPYSKPKDRTEAVQFWKLHVESSPPKFEGVIARSNGDLYKIKPHLEVDAVIVGVNKRERFQFREVTSLKVALMDTEGFIIELGDVASGIEHELRKELWTLVDRFKIGEDQETVYVEPNVVVTLQFTETFDQQMRQWKYENGKYVPVGKRQAHTMRHPRLIGFRKDKKVNGTDLRLEQLA